MSNPDFPTTLRLNLLDRIAAGDNLARETLISHYMKRLRRLASVMLRGRAAVRRWEDTNDVLQNTLVRLNRALQVMETWKTWGKTWGHDHYCSAR